MPVSKSLRTQSSLVSNHQRHDTKPQAERLATTAYGGNLNQLAFSKFGLFCLKIAPIQLPVRRRNLPTLDIGY